MGKILVQLNIFDTKNYGVSKEIFHDTQASRMLSSITGIPFSTYRVATESISSFSAVATFNSREESVGPFWKLKKYNIPIAFTEERCLNSEEYFTLHVSDIDDSEVRELITAAFNSCQEDEEPTLAASIAIASTFWDSRDDRDISSGEMEHGM